MHIESFFVHVPDKAEQDALRKWLIEICYSEAATIFSTDSRGSYVWCIPHSEYTRIPHFVRILRKHIPENVYCCGRDVELFKALAALHGQTASYRWFISVRDPKCMIQNDKNPDDAFFTAHGGFRAATAEEIVSYFREDR